MNEDRNWMYTGRKTTDSITSEWIDKTTEFLDMAFSRNTGHYGVMCPCNQCFNRRPQIRSIMIKHLYKSAVTFYYARMKGQKIVRAQACRTKLTEAQYMQAIPSWAAPFEDCWLQVIRQKWCKKEWLQISESCRQRRSLMPGPSHHQGTASLTRFKDQMEEKEKRPVSDVSAYISSRKGSEGDSLCHDRAKRVVEKYAEVAKEKFGPDFDIMNEPLDPSCAYKAGCGKKNLFFLPNVLFSHVQIIVFDSESESSSGRSTRKWSIRHHRNC